MPAVHVSTVRGALFTTFVVGASLISGPTPAAAQSRVEFGASVINLTTNVGDNPNATALGIGTGGFGLSNPGAYGSFFLGRRVAVSPQVGLVWGKAGESSFHFVNLAARLEYLTKGADRSSPFVFGSVGVVESSGSSRTPKSVGGGVGYRARVGDRLTVRVDGRVARLTEGGGNSIGLTLSLGGLVGR